MREIKLIGRKESGGMKYMYGVYECPECKKHVEKIARDGRSGKYCSHRCYAVNRGRRGSYKDGIVVISGYLYEYQPDHPNSTKKGYVAQHRLVAESKLGRMLNDYEVVHHIDKNKTNNNPKNLMVLTNSDHMKLHKRKNHTPCEIVS